MTTKDYNAFYPHGCLRPCQLVLLVKLYLILNAILPPKSACTADAFGTTRNGLKILSKPQTVSYSRAFSFIRHAKGDVNIEDVATAEGLLSEENATQEEEKSMITFRGELTHSIAGVEVAQNKPLKDYFDLTESRRILLRGEGEDIVIDIDEPSSKLWDLYKVEAKRVGADPPSQRDSNIKFFRVESKGIDFVAIRLINVATVGTKVITSSAESDGNCYPKIEIVLVQSSTKADGPRFLVWLFNRMTGASEEKSTQMAHSRTRVLAKPSGKIDTDSEKERRLMTFETQVSLEVNVKFPSVLLKVMPMSKEKSEREGSAALLKSLEKGIPAALKTFKETYDDWVLAK